MQPPRILTISAVEPSFGVPGGEVIISCRGFKPDISSKLVLGDVEASIISASDSRIIARLPESPQSIGVALKVGRTFSAVFPFSLAARVATDLHPVSNPAIAKDGSIVTTISGSRGQHVPQPLVRITRSGDKLPYNAEILNPTGLAFSKDGQLYVSSRQDGTVLKYSDSGRLQIVAEDLGIPCGLAFDSENRLYVGDRTGKIYRIDESGRKEEFAQLEPSIAAYHLAIDSEDRLYVTGPTFSMRDRLTRLSRDGEAEILLDGLARPQGMVFAQDGDLLICAGYDGKKGVFRYSLKTGRISHYIAGPMLVGIAAAGQELILATSNSLYLLPLPGNVAVN